MKPKILVVTTRRWFSAARIAIAFSEAACEVEIVCPPKHPALLTSAVTVRHPFRAFRPLQSLHKAIIKAAPDLLVPTDDIAIKYLHRLYEMAPQIDEATGSQVRSLLERSLGDPREFALLSSRTDFLAAAQAEGVDVLPTVNIPNRKALDHWLAANPLPAVLKADGTSGGEGVAIVSTRRGAARAWRRLRAPIGLARVLKRAGFEHDAHHIIPWIRHHRRKVSIQPYIHGHDSNIAIACWKGEVLAAISMDVLSTWRQNGPAVLVQVLDEDHMLEIARKLARRFHLSGLCGFDFMTEYTTGRTYLLEINSRATQTCHLPYGIPCDLVPVLVSSLADRPPPEFREVRKRGIVSLFPLAWKAGISRETLASTYQDVPWQEPRLVRKGFAKRRHSVYETFLRTWKRVHSAKPLIGESK
ncbi:MAG: ATP-grasp domain-containing protein [Silvibacterium sp.]